MRPLAVIGNLSRDVVEGDPPRIGGAPFYAARALRLIGRPARIITRVAEEDRRLLGPLEALGLPVAWQPARATSAFSFSYKGDERLMHVEAIGDPWTVDDVTGWAAEALEDVEWVHAAPLLRSDFPAETLELLARGRRLSLDGQGLVRKSQCGPLALDAGFDRAVLKPVSMLKLADEEAQALGALDEAGLRALGVPEVVITLGSRGSLVWCDGTLERITPAPVREGVDPTGAGDAFAAAYVAARSTDHAPGAAARRASLVASALLTQRFM